LPGDEEVESLGLKSLPSIHGENAMGGDSFGIEVMRPPVLPLPTVRYLS
jgi:hypothetical protein